MFDGELEGPQAVVLYVLLHDDGALAPGPLAVELDAAGKLGSLLDLAVLDHGLLVHAHHVLTDGQHDAGDSAADSQPFPVAPGNVCRAQTRYHDGEVQADPVVVPQRGGDIGVREDGLVGVGGDSVRPDRGAHDVHVRVVDRVFLLRGRSHVAVGLGIEKFGSPHRRLRDLAIAGAILLADNAKAALGVDIVAQACPRLRSLRAVGMTVSHGTSCKSDLPSLTGPTPMLAFRTLWR